MRNSARWDLVFSLFSWLIVIALVYAVANIYWQPPSGIGPVAQRFGIQGAQLIYSVIYGGEALALFIAKLFRTKKFRKNVLMVVYLTGFFTTILSLLLVGFVPQVIDNLVIALSAAGCWLYWKHKTEYVNPTMFHKDIEELKNP